MPSTNSTTCINNNSSSNNNSNTNKTESEWDYRWRQVLTTFQTEISGLHLAEATVELRYSSESLRGYVEPTTGINQATN